MGEGASFTWVEEDHGMQNFSVGTKRKWKRKRLEYDGWGSKPLIRFLESIGVDTSVKISPIDVGNVVLKYINDNNLVNPAKKKRINCDEGLRCLFGKKTISRVKVHEFLERHFAENKDDSDSDVLFGSEEEDNDGKPKASNSERKVQIKHKVRKHPRSAFAAIVCENIKRIYLKKSLVEDLVKDLENFKRKIVGSFVKIKSDPNDYLQKNSHVLVQVTGLKMAAGTDDSSTEILLTVSNYINDVQISMLSDKNLLEEECEDLKRRMEDGYLDKLNIGVLEEKIKVLHEDVTKHWLMEELALLDRLIEQANVKGWRYELFEYLERKRLLQTPAEQLRLLNEIPEVIAEETEADAQPEDGLDTMVNKNNLPKSTTVESPEYARDKEALAKTSSASIPCRPNLAENHAASLISKQCNTADSHCDAFDDSYVEQQHNQTSHDGTDPQAYLGDRGYSLGVLDAPQVQVSENHQQNNGGKQPVRIEANFSNPRPNLQVIDLSDNEDDEDKDDNIEIIDFDLRTLAWYYTDPQGNTQGPFSMASLKRWSDAQYFPPGFKVWKSGQNKKDAVLLRDILRVFADD